MKRTTKAYAKQRTLLNYMEVFLGIRKRVSHVFAFIIARDCVKQIFKP